MFILNTIISGGPGLFFVVVLWTLICMLHQINLHTSWFRYCRLFFKQGENPILKHYNTTKGQLFDSPTGFSFLSTFYPPGLTPVIKSNRPDFRALLSGSAKKAGFLLGIFVFLSFSKLDAATITATRPGGNWSAAATWIGGAVPESGDDVSIPDGSTVTIDTNPIVGSLSVSGILQFEVTTARSITVLTQVTVNSGGVFQSAQSGFVKNHQLIVQGSVINDGKIDFSSSSNATGVEIVFTGSNNAIFNCSDAPLTNLRQTGIILNKGTSATSVLSFIPGNTFQVLSDGGSNAKGFLSIINGTFNIIGSNRFSNPVFNTEGDYTIPATGGFWLGNQNATVVGMNGSVTNLGELKITNGIYHVGISGGNSLETLTDGQFKMSGGTLNIVGNFKMDGGNATISGGRINLSNQANSADQVPTLSMSGQTNLELYGTPVITIAYPNLETVPCNDIQIEVGSGLKSVTGGAIQLGTEVTPAGSSFFVSGDPVLNRLTVLNECTIQVFNTSKYDLTITPISSLPKIAFDETAPELTAPEKITLKCGEIIPAAYASMQEFMNAGGVASDNCTLVPASFKLVGQVQSSANCPYTVTRTYEISDGSGNVATVEHLIVVEGEGTGAQPEAVTVLAKEEAPRLKSAMASYTAISGNWSDPLTWGGVPGGPIPTAADDVIIPNGVTVTVDAAAFCKDITIQSGGTLTITGTSTLQINANWTNNGNFISGTNGTVEFAGSLSPAILGGTSATIFKNFIINKGAVTNIIQVNSDITLGGDITFTSGKMQVNTGADVTCTHNAGFLIKNIAGLFINGGTFTTGAFSIDNEGLFQIDSGTITIGTSSGNGIVVKNSGIFDINGGTVNVAGRLEISGGTADISGGTINLNTVGHNSSTIATLDLSLASDFHMTAGTINFLKPNGTGNLDVLIENGVGGNKSFTGGVLNIGTGTSDTYRITCEIPFPPISATLNTNLILEMLVSANGIYSFPLVTNTSAAIPATINLTSNGGFATDASIQIESTGTDHPNNASATNFLNRYWTVTTSGITSPVYNITATYAATDIAGTETEIAFGNWTGSLPWIKGSDVNAGSNTISKTGITSTSFVFTGITSDPPTVDITNGSSVAICNGSSVNLTTTASGDPTLTYSWSPATGLSATNVLNPVANPTATTNYMITVTDGNGFTATDVITVTVNPLPTATAGSNSPLCTGQTLNLTASGGTSYSWTGPNGYTSSLQNPSIPIVSATASGTYNVTVTDANGCSSVASTSVTVNPAPSAIITISPGNTICSGATVTFTATTVSNAGANPTYQWQSSLDGTTWTNISGATNPVFSSSTLVNAQRIRLIVTADPAYCSSNAVSNIYTMTVNPPVIPTVTILESANPICAGTTVNFSAIVVNPGTTPTYQWQTSSDGTTWTNISGATSSPFSSSTLVNGERIRVLVTSNATCTINNPATSSAIIMTVNPQVIPLVSIDATQTTICPGTSVTFTATPTNGGTNPSYQWKVNGTNVGSNGPNYTSASLNNGDIVSVVMTSNVPCASPTLANSNNITMTVNPGTPAIPGAISGTNPACPVLTGQIYSVAPVPNATSYTWTVPSGWAITSGAVTNSITVTTGNSGDNGNITVTASNSCGTSAVRTLAVTVGSVSTAPTGVTITNNNTCFGTSKTLSVTGGSLGTGASWEWFTGSCGGTSAGTGSSITVNPAAGTSTTYYVRAAGTCNTTTCTQGTVTVSPAAPAQPAAITGTTPVCPAVTGMTYSISAVADATSYTWTVPTGWSITAGAGTNSITVTSGSAGQNGNISVTATNSCGTSTAQTLAVTVSAGAPATPGVITGTANQCINRTGLIYSIAAVPNATNYTWTVPSGWTVTAGAGTTSITVSTGAAAVSGNITVTASNTCATSSASSFAVIVSPAAPVTPNAPTGDASVCTSATLLNYTTTAVTNAISYTWTIPSGWTIVSGAGTNSISVNMGTAANGNYNISVRASNACGTSASSANLVVSVGDYATANAGADQAICASTASINVDGIAGGAANAAKGTWTRSGTGTFGNANKPSTTYTPSTADRTAGTVTLTFTTDDPNGDCNPVSDQMVLTLRSNPIASISGSTTICANSSTAVRFAATPNTTLTYKVNGGTDITLAIGATGSATVNTGSLVTNTTYALTNVVYTTAPSCSQTVSGSAVITVNPAATANAGVDQTICANGSATLAGSVGGTATSGIWSGGAGTFSPNNTTLNAVYTPSAAEISAGSVNLILTTNDPDGAGPCSAATDFMVLTINPLATVNAGLAQTICAGSTATMAGSIGGSSTAANWSGGGGGFSPNNTALNVVYTPTAAEVSAGLATLTLTTDDPLGPCGPVSATVVLTINPLATVNAGTDQTVCSSSPVTLAGTVGGGASTATWSGGFGTFSPNANTLNAVYTPSAAEIADGIVVLTLTTNDPTGPCGAVSDQVQININPAATVNAGLDQNICQGSFIILSGTIGGAATLGTWSGGTGTFSPNNTVLNATYTPGIAETGLVTLTLTTNDPAGTCTVATDQVVITIDPKPIVTVSPNQMICSNATATVTGTIGGGATSASWSTSGFGTFDNSTSATAVYTPGNGDISNGIVTLTYTTNDPNGICGPASAAVILTVKKVIVITSEPLNTGACATYPADLIVTAVGDNLTYQWYRGIAPGTPVVNSSNILGAQSATLHFNNATSVDAGSYYVVISSANACSSETSNTVTLNVDQEITVTTQIQSNSVCVGDLVTFSIVAEPGGSLTYQWRKNGVSIPGETTNTLNLGNVDLTDNGSYDVQINGLAGYTCSDAQSATATLTVNTDATIALTSASGTNAQNGCLNQPITNITYAVGGGATNANVSGLPAGVTGVYNSGVFTISGTPTATGTFNYTINTTGNCSQTSTSGTIIINPSPTITLGTVSSYCPGVTSFSLPYLSTTENPNTYSISAGTPALSGFVPVAGSALGASPINVSLPAGVVAGTYQFVITVKNSDNCSSVSQTFTITLEDVTPPVKPILLNLSSQCSITPTAPTTTDNCSGTITGTTTTNFPYTTTGVSSIVWTFTDAAGNSTTATQVVTINDQTAPTWVSFPADVLDLECGASLNTTPAATGSPTATDNCSTVAIGYTESVTVGTCSSRYTINRIWQVTDASGNTRTRTQTINVVDTTPPVISCTPYPNFNANVVPASDLHTGVSAIDLCSPSGAITYELISEEYFGLDVSAGWCPTSLERVYVARDACGNVSSPCTQTYTFIDNPNCQACIDDPTTTEDNVPFFPVIFTQPDQSWTSPSVVRNGICCFAEGPPPPRCISFNVYLDPDAVGLIFTIPTGAIPGGALYYHVDCGPPQKVGEVLCLSGGRFYTITFCEPGNNPNTYSIQSISGAATTDDIITRADANCIKNITVTGLQPGTVNWTVKFPLNSDYLLNYLSCTDCTTPTFTPDVNTPPTIIYEVCGQLTGTYVCNGLPIMDCAELTVTTLPPITISFNVDLDNICADEIPGIDATVTPGGFNYDYKWYNSAGNLIWTGATWTPTAEGNYSLVVTENESGISCNSSTYSFTITFDYQGPGTLNVPPPLVIECNQSNAETLIAEWYTTATAADANISGIPVTNDYTIFTHLCGGVRTVTFSASDNCGNTTTGTSQIRIIDTTPPVITTPAVDQTVECDGSGNTAALNSWLASHAGAAATDACGGTLTWTNNYTTLSDLCGATGAATVTFTVTDACGNTATTVATFTIVDTQAPTISCPPTATGNTDANECYSTTVDLGTATAIDNCGTVTITNNAPAQFPAGTTTVTWTATDACGNTATCTQLVIVTDTNQPPTITCPASVEETIAADQCSKTGVTPGLPTISDNCPNPAITYTLTGATTGSGAGTVSNTTFNVGVTTITYTVTDAGGGTASCSFTVWIKRLDIPAASIQCPGSPAPVNVTSGCTAMVTVDSPVITDVCQTATYTMINDYTGTATATANYPVGTTTVTWTIRDNSGNVTTCVQTVTVIDNQPPTFAVCPTSVTETIAADQCTKTDVTITAPQIADNCSSTLTYTIVDAIGGTTSGTGIISSSYPFEVGTNTVTYVVTDAGGLSATCTFTVTIRRLNIPPASVQCPVSPSPVNVASGCDAFVTVDAPQIIDICRTATFTVTNDYTGTDNASGSYPVGTTTVTWTIRDNSGNVTTCVQTVTVIGIPPVIACPPSITAPADFEKTYKEFVNVDPPAVTPSCPIESLTWIMAGATTDTSSTTGTNTLTVHSFNIGVTNVTYTVTDDHGLSASCTFTVTIIGKPIIDCPATITSTTDPGVCTKALDPGVPTLRPGSPPATSWTWVMTGATTGSGGNNGSDPLPISPNPPNTFTFNEGVTTITWTACNISGCSTPCT